MPSQFSCLTGPVTSTGEINQIPFKMYPNPNNLGSLTIEAEANITEVVIHNLLGQTVSAQKVDNTLNQTQVNLTNLEQGMYLVNLIFENDQISIQKLVVE